MSKYAICIEGNGKTERDGWAMPTLGKVYKVVEDEWADANGLIRIIDDSGEDYLYAVELFMPIELPEETAAALERAWAEKDEEWQRRLAEMGEEESNTDLP